MAVVEQITSLLLIADAYILELASEILEDYKKGCDECAIKPKGKLQQVIMLKEQLSYQVSVDDMGTVTDLLFSCMLKAIDTYSGASISVDPNANVPNTTIDVEIIGNDSPYEVSLEWDDFIDNGEEGRIRLEMPEWVEWLPILSLDNVYLNFGNPFLPDDFKVLSTGGIELLPTGNTPAIYDGQTLRAVGYQPYTAPPDPVATQIEIGNFTSKKSDGVTNSIGSQSVNITSDMGGLTLGNNSSTTITSVEMNITTAGGNLVMKKADNTLININGGGVDNVFTIEYLSTAYVNFYNDRT